MLVRNAKAERFDIPHEPGEWMELVMLSWKQLRDAQKSQERENREVIKDLGGEIVKAMQSGNAEKVVKVLEDQEYDLRNYYIPDLLMSGIRGWSYDTPFDDRSVLELDKATAKWAAETILKLSRPPTKEQEKNDSPPS